MLKNENKLKKSNFSPDEIYQLYLLEYLKISPTLAPLIYKSENKIIWEPKYSFDDFDIFQGMQFNSDKIFGEIYETLTQAFLSQIDSQLRFHRGSYSSNSMDNCNNEMIYRVNYEKMMRLALEEALISFDKNFKGYGSLILYNNSIIARTHDTLTNDRNPLDHAVFKCIFEAQKKLGRSNLKGGILFSTCEPCPMCSSYALLSNISTIVFGVSTVDMADLGFPRIMVSVKDIAQKTQGYIEVIDHILYNECYKFYEALI